MSVEQMVVLHLETGHVLASASAEGSSATAESLTGGSHLVVRAASTRSVRVPLALLAALSTDADRGVLVAPMSYRVVDAIPRVSHVGAPAMGPPATAVGAARQEYVAVWQVGRSVEVVRANLTDEGKFVLKTPPGGTHAIVALEGQPLFYT